MRLTNEVCTSDPHYTATMITFVSLLVISVVSLSTGQKCDDISPGACQLLVQSQPNYCSDASARHTCPRFCKMCPVECYNCNATILDYHDCNTTMLCPEGQICMKKELKSYIDGHHEYEMTCESKQACDGGQGLSIPFGKRDKENRDISITCCGDDLCNYPDFAPTIANGCPKDIIFMIDESSKVLQNEYTLIKNQLIDMARRLPIGDSDNLVAVYGFDSQIHTKFDLDANLNQGELLSALPLVHFQTGSYFARGDTTEAVEFLVKYATTSKAGDRPDYPDVIVFISDAVTSQHFHLSVLERMMLQHASKDVITVTVGTSSTWSIPTDQMATDGNHKIHVNSLSDPRIFFDKILPLITAC